jgi:hypothetical protein
MFLIYYFLDPQTPEWDFNTYSINFEKLKKSIINTL